MNLIKWGLLILIIGLILTFFSTTIIEDWLGIKRAFLEEPLSVKVTRIGLILAVSGIIVSVVGLFRKRRAKKSQA
jgi:uncharacterized membrane protein